MDTSAHSEIYRLNKENQTLNRGPNRFVLDDFERGYGDTLMISEWTGFTDQVMGGRSNAEFYSTRVLDKRCLRMTGNVTCAGGGGFAQMAIKPGGRKSYLDLSAFSGIEVLTLGNNQHYNIHLRTTDVACYEQSYRLTFFAAARWEKHCFRWEDFEANGIKTPLNTAQITRIGFLGWMRDFHMDLSIGEVAFFA